MLPRHAHCVLSSLRCNGHSLLLSSYFSRIGRIKNPSCSACGHPSQDTSHLNVHRPATDSLRARSLATLCLSLSTTSGPDSGKLPGFWGSMVFCNAPSLGRGRVATITLHPHREMDKAFSPSYSSSQISFAEAEAVEFLRFHFRFNRKRTASSFRFRFHIPHADTNIVIKRYVKPYIYAITKTKTHLAKNNRLHIIENLVEICVL